MSAEFELLPLILGSKFSIDGSQFGRGRQGSSSLSGAQSSLKTEEAVLGAAVQSQAVGVASLLDRVPAQPGEMAAYDERRRSMLAPVDSYDAKNQGTQLQRELAAMKTDVGALGVQGQWLEALAPEAAGEVYLGRNKPVGMEPGGDYLGLWQDPVDLQSYLPVIPPKAPPPYT